MPSQWRNVPLEDYEGHMDAAGQLAVLRDLFTVALRAVRPASVAVLGIAGGNGLECIDSGVTQRVAGIDLLPSYLDAVRERHGSLPGLELYCADLSSDTLRLEPVRLVHAALVFEHAGVGRCLENALSMVAPGGVLSVVLQLPSPHVEGVTPSRFASMQALKDEFSLIDPAVLSVTLSGRGFGLARICRHAVRSGKAFWMGMFAGPRGKME